MNVHLLRRVAGPCALATVLLLSACGGGDDDDDAVTTASVNPSATSTALVAGAPNDRQLTLASFQTGDGVYQLSVDGQAYTIDVADGLTVTSPPQTTVFESDFLMLCREGEARAVLSHPMATSAVPATPDEIKGKTFMFVEDCVANADDLLTFNQDGTATSLPDTVSSAQEVRDYFTTEGSREGTARFRGHLYKVADGDAFRHIIVETWVEDGVEGVSLLVEVNND